MCLKGWVLNANMGTAAKSRREWERGSEWVANREWSGVQTWSLGCGKETKAGFTCTLHTGATLAQEYIVFTILGTL